MPFIGNQPAKVPLTSADITDGIIVNADISSTAGITLNKLSGNPNFRNIVINGDMQIAQRSTSVASITTGGYYTLDRFNFGITTMGTFTMSQSTDVPSGYGFANSLKLDCTTADASPASGDLIVLNTIFEGQNLQYLKKGTANAQSLTLSFWVKSTKTGTFIAELQDTDNSRTINKSYTVSASNTWEFKTITFAGDTTGTLTNDNGSSLVLRFWLGAGTDFTSGTLQTTWGTQTSANRAVGQVNIADSTSNDWLITGVQLEAGTSATDFEFLPYDVSLDRCQRYFQAPSKGTLMQNYVFSCYASTSAYGNFGLIKSMRASPTITFNTTGAGGVGVYYDNNSRTLTSISLAYASTDRVGVTLVGSGWAGGGALHLNNDNASVPFFTASSEL